MKINIKKVSIGCPMGNTVISAIQNGNVPKNKVILEKVATGINAYLDAAVPTNKIGIVMQPETVAEMDDAIESGEYACLIESLNADGTILADLSNQKSEKTKAKETASAGITSAIEKIVADGIETKGVCEKAVEIMKAHNVDEPLMLAVLKGWKKTRRPFKDIRTVYVNPEKTADETLFSEALRNAVFGIPTIYEGDKSVGKNVCAETIAFVLHKDYDVITFSRQMSPDDVYGTKSTDNSASDALTPQLAASYLEFQKLGEKADEAVKKEAAQYEYLKAKSASVSIVQDESAFVEWLRFGGVMCFNEMNMADANFLASFTNQITDGTGFIFIPGVGNVNVNPDCVLIGTQNADYQGTEQQNDATTSRFACIEFPYPPSIKAQLKAAVGKEVASQLEDIYFEQADKAYKELLKAVHDSSVTNTALNIRGFVRALKVVAKSGKISKLLRQVQINVVNTCPTDERSKLMLIIQRCITC